jgi:hypothetical protein
MRGNVALGIASMVLASACVPIQVACTDIGSESGVAVTVDQALAPDVTKLALRVCWDGACQDSDVPLSPGTEAWVQGCDGPDPEDTCSASVVPNGTKVGFAVLEGLPASKITVSATLTQSPQVRKLRAIDLTARPTYPNGPGCGAGGNQAQVSIGLDGLR